MKKNLLKIKYLALSGILFPLISFAQYNFEESSGLNTSAEKAGYNDALKQMNSETLLIKGIGLVLAFVGVLFLILMIVAGFRWMIARGNETEVEKAKKLIINSIIGLIITLASYIISYFVVDFFGASFLK